VIIIKLKNEIINLLVLSITSLLLKAIYWVWDNYWRKVMRLRWNIIVP
jgi:hypothetical protein